MSVVVVVVVVSVVVVSVSVSVGVASSLPSSMKTNKTFILFYY